MEANQEATALLLNGVAGRGAARIGTRAATRPSTSSTGTTPRTTPSPPSASSRSTARAARRRRRSGPTSRSSSTASRSVVVECKSPTVSEPIAAAIDQLRRYHNARKQQARSKRTRATNASSTPTSSSSRRATTRRVSAPSAREPSTTWSGRTLLRCRSKQVQVELGKDTLSSQNKLIAGMLRPAHLLDIIRHFTVYQQVSGKTVKIVCRYQQFRAVQYAVERLLARARRARRTASTTGAAGSSGTRRARGRA